MNLTFTNPDHQADANAKSAAIRGYRADLKRRLARREVGFASVIDDPAFAGRPVIEVVCSLPRFARTRASRMFAAIGLDAATTCGDLSRLERRELLIALGPLTQRNDA